MAGRSKQVPLRLGNRQDVIDCFEVFLLRFQIRLRQRVRFQPGFFQFQLEIIAGDLQFWIGHRIALMASVQKNGESQQDGATQG